MELTRRGFAGLVAAAGVACWSGLWRVAARAAPQRVFRAACARIFPGRVRPLDPEAVRRPARWLG